MIAHLPGLAEDAGGRTAARAAWIACHTLGAVSGMSRCVMPNGLSASITAFTTAGGDAISPPLPRL